MQLLEFEVIDRVKALPLPEEIKTTTVSEIKRGNIRAYYAQQGLVFERRNPDNAQEFYPISFEHLYEDKIET